MWAAVILGIFAVVAVAGCCCYSHKKKKREAKELANQGILHGFNWQLFVRNINQFIIMSLYHFIRARFQCNCSRHCSVCY